MCSKADFGIEDVDKAIPNFEFMSLALPLSSKLEHLNIVSELDQEIPQSKNADNPNAPRGTATKPSRDTRKKNKAKHQLSLSSLSS